MSIAKQKRLVSLNHRALLALRARPRSGKVARLPYATRERINQMIEDGFPYKAIIEKLNQGGVRKLHHFCTVSSPIFRLLKNGTLIINDFQNFLHRDVV